MLESGTKQKLNIAICEAFADYVEGQSCAVLGLPLSKVQYLDRGEEVGRGGGGCG